MPKSTKVVFAWLHSGRTYIDKMPADDAPILPSGVYDVQADGSLVVSVDSAVAESIDLPYHMTSSDSDLELCRLSYGCYGVVGAALRGKSMFMIGLSTRFKTKVWSLAEPGGGVPPSPLALPVIINGAPGPFVFIDGARYLVMSEGSAGMVESGIPRDVALFLTTVDAYAIRARKVIFVALNPMSPRGDDALSALAHSSCSGVFEMNKPPTRDSDGRRTTVFCNASIRPIDRKLVQLSLMVEPSVVPASFYKKVRI